MIIKGELGIIYSGFNIIKFNVYNDLVQRNSGEKLFEKGRQSLRHAEKIGLGTMEYELVII